MTEKKSHDEMESDLANAERHCTELLAEDATAKGRLEVATAVREILRALMHGQELPAMRKPTEEESKVWELLEGVAERCGYDKKPEETDADKKS